MPGRSRPGRSHGRDLGQHFLESAALASHLVADAGIAPSDQVVEYGAGTGTLTAALADCGAHVLAIEVDPALAAGLTRRFAAARVRSKRSFVALSELTGSDLSEYPNVKRWLGRMKSLKNWQKVNEVIDGYGASLKGNAMQTV